MSAKVKTRCPVCAARYYVVPRAVGRRARCPGCDSVFRVALLEFTGRNGPTGSAAGVTISSGAGGIAQPPGVNGRKHPLTEDDILRWLNEADDESEFAVRPRVISDAAEPESMGPAQRRPEEMLVDAPGPPPRPSPVATRALATPTQLIERRAAC